ncbi:hypothetical protein HIM_03824 [Hirsutella minnesotensis 3608]|uniref:FAD-binding domain-containing protein n=1 Tax=Hirsutella minnesotensis 3608 TaxID=1043627 RepID=A0A0F8A2D1_9HYPO|nr:hypothetical protein HIM_03824 [Hirsutella minnesotensis 3608]
MDAGVEEQNVDVAIIGGGPTGLFTGLLLSRLGVSVCVLDAKPKSLDLGRADALNARTQQYLEIANLLEPLLSQGIKCNTSSTFGDGEFKSRQNKWWIGLEHALHKNFLMLGQPVVEELFSSELKTSVHYGEQVSSVRELEDAVEIATTSGRRVRSRFAIGADGARSMVRREMGVSFTGTKPEMLWAVLDTFIDTDFPVCPEIITFELNGQSRVSWIPRERGLCRFYVLIDGEVTQERAQESIKQHMAPYNIEFTKTEWFSTFEVKERVASSFVSRGGEGRLILAGDAAHVHSVNGGQGLNTGISDAFSLAWRLATILNNHNLKPEACDKIIRSYDIERRGTAQNVVDVAAALVRDTIRKAKQYVGTIEKNAGYITGMGVSYESFKSPLIWASERGIWKAGHRCPDVILRNVGGKNTRLYTEAIYGNYIILLIGNHRTVANNHGDITKTYRVRPALTNSTEGKTLNSGECAYEADWVSDEDSFVVVVRPDMYIGYVGENVDDCSSYLDELYCRTSTR